MSNFNDAWSIVSKARDKKRPCAKVYINSLFNNFIEFHGDRYYGDDPSIMGGIASIDGIPVTVIAQVKGENTKENIKRNFGMPHPEGYRKALRLMKQAEKFKRPIICFVDTPGAFCGMEAEERGQGEAIAKNLFDIMRLKTPIISIIIGEGGSGGALALSIGDEILMLENSIYSILSPEGFASILWKDVKRAKEAAEVMKITAKDLKSFGIIDKIIYEPEDGVHHNVEAVVSSLRYNIIDFIKRSKKSNLEIMLQNRYDRFRKIGKFME